MLARFKSLFLVLINVFRRALCCFSRRRKTSHSECEMLTSINVVQNNNNHGSRNRDEVRWLDETNIDFIFKGALRYL